MLTDDALGKVLLLKRRIEPQRDWWLLGGRMQVIPCFHVMSRSVQHRISHAGYNLLPPKLMPNISPGLPFVQMICP